MYNDELFNENAGLSFQYKMGFCSRFLPTVDCLSVGAVALKGNAMFHLC